MRIAFYMHSISNGGAEKVASRAKIGSSHEHLIYDGASTDGTLELLRELELKFPRLEVYSEPDTGLYYTTHSTRASVSPREIAFAREAGYPCAFNCTTRAQDDLGPFFAVRLTLPPNKVELHYILSGLQCFMDSERLMRKV